MKNISHDINNLTEGGKNLYSSKSIGSLNFDDKWYLVSILALVIDRRVVVVVVVKGLL